MSIASVDEFVGRLVWCRVQRQQTTMQFGVWPQTKLKHLLL